MGVKSNNAKEYECNVQTTAKVKLDQTDQHKRQILLSKFSNTGPCTNRPIYSSI
jgi:hypothetical protein